MNKKLLSILLTLVLALSVFALIACNVETSGDETAQEQQIDPTLINSFDSLADMYLIKPVAINPTDVFVATINTDANYVTDGTGSFRYQFIKGTTHQFLQLFEKSHIPQFDVKTLASISLDVYNANDNDMKLTLSVTTAGGATICDSQQVVSANSWTTVKLDNLDEFSYKKKSNIGGIAFRFDTTTANATFYVDNIRVEGGASDLPPINLVDYVNELYETRPAETLTDETFDTNVKFVDRTYYAKQLYDELADKSSVSSIQDKLNECIALSGSFAPVYSAHDDSKSIDKWYYGAGMTVNQDEDDNYGTIWSVAIDTGSGREQSIKFEHMDVSSCSNLVFYVYNPTNINLRTALHGGWSDWNFQSYTLPANQWTKITINTKWIERDIKGAFYMVMSYDSSYSGMFKITSIFGMQSTEPAQAVVQLINQLPNEADLTIAHTEAVANARQKYQELSSYLQSYVSNYKKLCALEDKLNGISAVAFDEKIANVIAVQPTLQNASNCYFQATELIAMCDSLDDAVKSKLTKYAELISYKLSLDEFMPVIINDLIASLPSVEQCEMPRDLVNVMNAKACYDGLNRQQQQAVVGADKLNALVEETTKYTALYTPSSESIAVIDIKQDFGNAWSGTIGAETDSTYGPIMTFDVVAGHANAPREAEFKLIVLDSISQYESIVFYVYSPQQSGSSFRAYRSDWRESKDYKLNYGWNRVEVETDFFSSDNLAGCFFLLTGATSPAGKWKVTTMFGYVDQQATEQALDNFQQLVDAIPQTVTLSSQDAVASARKAYDELKAFVKQQVSQSLVKKLTDAEKTIAELKLHEKENIFIESVNSLSSSSSALDIYHVDYQYYLLEKSVKNNIPSEVVGKLQGLVADNAVAIAGEIDKDIELKCADLSFPRDLNAFDEFYTYVYATPDAVFNALTKKSVTKSARDEWKKYQVAYRLSDPFVNVERKAVADDDFSTVYQCTLYTEAHADKYNFAKFVVGTISNYSKIVFYVYRPEGGAQAFFYGAVDGKTWEMPDQAKVYICDDGWTRVELDATIFKNSNYDNYLYLFLRDTDFTGESQSGWIVTDIYGIK